MPGRPAANIARMTVAGFTETSFTHDGTTRTVYRRGSGPGVIVMHEIPGITPPVAAFATRVADEGFSVFLPHLFGTPGKPLSPGYTLTQIARACISREFSVLAARASSPITHWLRALCRHAHAELGGKGVGAIGMCLTGNFALALMVDPIVMAPVLSQPSLPFAITPALCAGLHLSDADLAIVKQRVADGCPVLGLRFTGDRLVPKLRFDSLRRELGPGFEAIEIDSSWGNPAGIKLTAHSVVTNDLIDEEGHPTRAALTRVLGFFRERLV
jgi:dienelactone hydrolase